MQCHTQVLFRYEIQNTRLVKGGGRHMEEKRGEEIRKKVKRRQQTLLGSWASWSREQQQQNVFEILSQSVHLHPCPAVLWLLSSLRNNFSWVWLSAWNSVHPALLSDSTPLFALQTFHSDHKSYSCCVIFFHLWCLYLSYIQMCRQIEGQQQE